MKYSFDPGMVKVMDATLSELEFPSRRGLLLRGTLHRPPRSASGAVVVAHGMLSSRASEKHQAICRRAAEAGFVALRFDFAGRGESQGGVDDLTVSGEVADLRAAVALMRELGFARPALVGSSLGGTVAILVAAEDRGIARLVSIAAPAVLPRRPRAAWGGDAAVSEAFFADARSHDVAVAARRVRCPWLVIHGADDEVVAVDDARRLAAANSAARLHIRPGADHRFAGDGEREWLVEMVVEELRSQL